MNSVVEECPVCWRSFGPEIIPTSLVCGHSMCVDCAETLKKCPLCRRRLSSNATRAPNYTLLSLIDRLGESKREMKDQQVQTDSSSSRPGVLKVEPLPFQQPLGILRPISLGKRGLTFKIKSNREGLPNGFEVRF